MNSGAVLNTPAARAFGQSELAVNTGARATPPQINGYYEMHISQEAGRSLFENGETHHPLDQQVDEPVLFLRCSRCSMQFAAVRPASVMPRKSCWSYSLDEDAASELGQA